jgi:hypothetical protein
MDVMCCEDNLLIQETARLRVAETGPAAGAPPANQEADVDRSRYALTRFNFLSEDIDNSTRFY